ncbi:MAG: GTP-binding protein [Promethearchaeota archaeon]|nr:MAG: GTP-binding protein [Candidatus Lokiarchaeota archaeon]
MVETEKISKIIAPYLNLDGVDFVAIVDFEGSLIYKNASSDCIKSEEDLNELIKSVIERITDKYNAGSLYADNQRIVFVKTSSKAIVITCIQSMVSLDAIFPYAYVIAEKVGRTLDNRPVLPILPDFGRILTRVQPKKPTGPKGFFLFSKAKPTQDILSFKMVIGGEFAVGKTSLVHTFITGKFEEDYKATIGTAILKKDCVLNNLNVTVKLVVWDLGGQQQFAQVRTKYMKDAKAGFLVFDVTRPETFEKIPNWYDDFKKNADSSLELILIGNKVDLEDERKITTQQGIELAKSLGIPYLETSALNRDVVEETFQLIAFKLIQDKIEITET